jgi:hypothetical protein
MIQEELQNQDLDNFTYDTQNISRNIHTASSFQLFPLPTDIEETHHFTVRILIFLFCICSKKRDLHKNEKRYYMKTKNHSQRRGLISSKIGQYGANLI